MQFINRFAVKANNINDASNVSNKALIFGTIFNASGISFITNYMNLSHYSFLSLEIRFFPKIGFLKWRFLVKNPTIFIHYSAFLNSGIGSLFIHIIRNSAQAFSNQVILRYHFSNRLILLKSKGYIGTLNSSLNSYFFEKV